MYKNKEFRQEFKKLAKEDKMPISSVEDLMQKNVEEYKNELLKCTEEMLMKMIDEKDLVAKKKIPGIIKELDLKISERENLNLR